MSDQPSPKNPGGKVGLNPQPLPPRWLPSWLRALLARLGLLRR